MYGYPMNNFNNNQMYIQDLQNMRDRIDKQMMQMQQPVQQQTPAINQTFQITPTGNVGANDIEGKIVNDIEEAKNTLVLKTGVFLTADYKTAYVKDVSGNIRTFNLNEIIELDEKDKQIIALQQQIEEMKGMIDNGKYDNANVDGTTTTKKSTRLSNAKSNDE